MAQMVIFVIFILILLVGLKYFFYFVAYMAQKGQYLVCKNGVHNPRVPLSLHTS